MVDTQAQAKHAAALSFWKRLALAIRVLFDRALAARLLSLTVPPSLPEGAPAPEPEPAREVGEPARKVRVEAPDPLRDRTEGALALLALFQTEGRLVDFLEQDIRGFADADIGAAARVVHEGCRKALHAHSELERVRAEPEGSRITLASGFDGASVRLTGDVRGQPPYAGVLRHAGWRMKTVRLPEKVAGHDSRVIAPAEVEL